MRQEYNCSREKNYCKYHAHGFLEIVVSPSSVYLAETTLKPTLVTDANADEVAMLAKKTVGFAKTMAIAVSSSSTVGTYDGSGKSGPRAGTVTVTTKADVTDRMLAERFCTKEPNDN